MMPQCQIGSMCLGKGLGSFLLFILFRQSVMKYERLKGVKKLRRRFTKTSTISAESYFLNKGNSEECRVMKKEE